MRGAEEVVDGVKLRVVRVQGDPFAPPSVVRVETQWRGPRGALEYPVPLADWIARRLYASLRRRSRKLGEGHSGLLAIPRPGPVIIRRSSVEVKGARVVARVWVGLPSRGRRVLADRAEELLLEALPEAVREALTPLDGLEEHVYAWRLQEALRSQLKARGLVSFIGDGSILPRRCGGCEDPLPGAVPFESPPSLRVSLEGPRGEEVTGMGIPRGFTVIAGSAFHGKSTLLEAIAAGVWNHVPGDGRERVVTIRNAMYVRAEDGRFVSCVDVSPMIHDLPSGGDTRCFTTTDASGATSTAASIQEAVEAGAELVLLDEDTAASNILYMDERARPITEAHTVTPISMLARSLAENGVSVVVVSSGSLPLLAVADTVVVMEAYKPRDATEVARRLAEEHGVRIPQEEYRRPTPRVIVDVPRLVKPKLRGGRLEDRALPAPVDLRLNMHLAEESQFNTLLRIAAEVERFKGKPVALEAARVEELIEKGFENLGGEPGPALGEVRALDVAFLVNRIPGVKARLSRPAS
ncbi:ABC-ATPase domain-containing protein [Stetteria hydrogenophila]